MPPVVARILYLVLMVAVVGGAYALARRHSDTAADLRYRTATVTRGQLVQSVSANGTLNPVVLVNVGTQVSGTIHKLHADFNDKVQAGQVLAELDPALLRAALAQSKAQMQQSQAMIAQNLATIEQNQAQVVSAAATLKLNKILVDQTRQLWERRYAAQTDLDNAVQRVEVAQAALASAQATLANSRAALNHARADLERTRALVQRDETNLAYSIITSPVSGVVISRNVDLGQTVAANFQTPTLFQIAQDLKKMQIDTSLAEADVGNVRVGQAVRFTVDAFPDETFQGVVRQIRLNATIQQNVVTYDVVIGVDNPQERFLPGMTAFVTIAVAERDNVLRIPLAALRFKPSDPGQGAAPEPTAPADGKLIYKYERGAPQAVRIHTGLVTAKYAEVVDGALHEGDAIVIEDQRAAKKSPNERSSRFRIRVF